MTVISYNEARSNLKEILNQVHDNQETITIVQDNGKHAVIMPEQDYNRLMETMYLLQSPANTNRLHESIQQLGQQEKQLD